MLFRISAILCLFCCILHAQPQIEQILIEPPDPTQVNKSKPSIAIDSTGGISLLWCTRTYSHHKIHHVSSNEGFNTFLPF